MLLVAEEKRREAWVVEEDVRFRQTTRVDQESFDRRIEQIAAMESSCRDYMEERDQIRRNELRRAQDESKRRTQR